ncbi:hypothetical protein D3C87_1464090 [compost metagenome]
MGDARPLDHDQIGPAREGLERRHDGGRLAEGEQLGDEGELGLVLDRVLLHQLEVRVGEQGDADGEGVVEPAVGDLDPRDELQLGAVVVDHDLLAEGVLQLLRLVGGEVPAVRLA